MERTGRSGRPGTAGRLVPNSRNQPEARCTPQAGRLTHAGWWISIMRTNVVHVVDSIWTADRIKRRAPALDFAGIVAGGLDTDLFRPRPVPQSYQLGCLGTEWLDDRAALAALRSMVGPGRLEL